MTNGLFSLQYYVIFSFKYRQQNVDLNPSKKSLVFVKIRNRKLHLYVQISYTWNLYLRKSTHLRKDAASLHFCLKESSENMIFPWNRNIRTLMKIWSFLSFSQIFVIWKFFFQCSDTSMWIYSYACIIHMADFSVKHKSQFLLPDTYRWALEAMYHFKLCWMLLFFNSNLHFESSVLFSLLLFLKDAVCCYNAL